MEDKAFSPALRDRPFDGTNLSVIAVINDRT